MREFKFFDLQSPKDLFGKLEHDFKRLDDNRMDSYAAFDFFITGYHMLDWCYPGNSNKDIRKKMREKEILIGICANIANGIKHFQINDPSLKSVSKAIVQEGAFDDNVFDSNIFQCDELVIQLDGNAAQKYGDFINCLTLAKNVLNYWRNEPKVKSA